MHTIQNTFAFQKIRSAEKIHVHKHTVQRCETFYWDKTKVLGKQYTWNARQFKEEEIFE